MRVGWARRERASPLSFFLYYEGQAGWLSFLDYFLCPDYPFPFFIWRPVGNVSR